MHALVLLQARYTVSSCIFLFVCYCYFHVDCDCQISDNSDSVWKSCSFVDEERETKEKVLITLFSSFIHDSFESL